MLNANTLNAQVSGNTTTASVQSLDTTGIVAALLGPISAGVISSSCTANSDGTFTRTASVANLSILGATFNGTPGANTNLSLSLPAGIASASVTLNEQVAGPVPGSVTVNAVHISFTTLGLATENIYIASSTCGPFSSPVPLASGKGLVIGLGAFGALAVGVGTTRLRRRRRLMAV